MFRHNDAVIVFGKIQIILHRLDSGIARARWLQQDGNDHDDGGKNGHAARGYQSLIEVKPIIAAAGGIRTVAALYLAHGGKVRGVDHVDPVLQETFKLTPERLCHGPGKPLLHDLNLGIFNGITKGKRPGGCHINPDLFNPFLTDRLGEIEAQPVNRRKVSLAAATKCGVEMPPCHPCGKIASPTEKMRRRLSHRK